MNRWTAALCAVMFAGGMAAATWWQTPVGAQGFTVALDCGTASSAQIKTTLYFGMNAIPTGVITELEWQVYLRDEVTRRFPAGLTVWDANGQWKSPNSGRIDQERSKVLLLVHPDSADARRGVQELIDTWRKQFQHEAVLWESSRVCVST
jgi:hypothetical protein